MLRPSPDFRYVTGWTGRPSPATFLVVTPDGPPVLVSDATGVAKAVRSAELPALEVVAADGGAAVYAALGSLVEPMERVGVDPAMPARELLALQEQLGPSTLLASAAPLMAALRLRKSAAEVEALERAAVAADRVLVAARDLTWSGHTEREMASLLRALLAEAGHEEVLFIGVAAGENSADPRQSPTDRVINPGDAVAVELTGRQAGYCSHTARMFIVAEPPEDFEALYSVVLAAQRAACEAVRPGVAAAEIDAVAREVIADSGYGAFAGRRSGHGIGLEDEAAAQPRGRRPDRHRGRHDGVDRTRHLPARALRGPHWGRRRLHRDGRQTAEPNPASA